MNTRTIQVMAFVALAMAGAAWYSTRAPKSGGSRAADSGTLLFPQLAKQAASVQKVQVQAKGQSFTLEKQGENWGMSEKGGYAVNFDKVKDLVGKLAYFEILEKKTDRPELFSKLELEDPSGPEAKSTRVTIYDGAGTTLADILLGKSASGGGPTLASLYVRRPTENQTYEVKGNVYVDGSANNWLDKQVAKLERARVHRVETVQADGTKLVIAKASPDDKNFAVAELPLGAELKWPGVADGIAGALEYLNFDDVDAVGKLDFNHPSAVTTTLQTFDGMLITVKVLEKEGKFYGQFQARFDPALRVEVTKLEPPAPAGPPAGEAGTTEPTPPAQPVETKYVPGKAAEEVAKEASELDARLSKWTYVIPGYAAANFTKKLSDMLKEVGPPLPPEGVVPPPAEGETPAATPPPVQSGGEAGAPAVQAPEQPLAPADPASVAPAVPASGGGGR
ncbi:MAG: DUF4340 domain-containing protein [Planctomycetes bacterium]|nr:DUF4340 domain-containing protein [Planctomycetota bacterium]